MLSVLNPEPLRLPGPELLHHLVQPPSDRPALEYVRGTEKSRLSYSELHAASDALTARIAQHWPNSKADNTDLGPVIPVLIPQCPSLYVSLLAILKFGGAFCPLNIDTPPERVRFILKDVSAKIVLVSRELASSIPTDIEASIIVVDDAGIIAPETEPRTLQYQPPTRQSLAYVMYTSGSTGTPKGVAISHGAITQALLAHDRHIPSFARFLQFAAPTFDVSVFEIFFPLFRGCTLICAHREELLNDLPAVLRDMEVDACELTPTVAGSLLRTRSVVPKLQLLLTIGEMLKSSVVQEFSGDENKPSILWAMYGPTEATVHCTLQGAFPAHSSTGNIGTPLDTVSCFVIEPATSPENSSYFQVLPIGEVGELAVGGHQLADGYLNRPEQTESAFIMSPYGRVYRTGDKARLKPDGTLECLGRLSDGQVKLNGQRLEIGEVEQALLRTHGCHGAAVSVIDAVLVAFCAIDEGVTDGAILESCRAWLPRFMVPTEIMTMKELPRLPSGKVDLKTLKSDHILQRAAETQYDAELNHVTETEREILRIISEILGTEMSRHTLLLSVGLDSLVAIRLASALRSKGFDISASNLLGLKAVSDIISIISRQPHSNLITPDTVDISYLGDIEAIARENPGLQAVVGIVEDILQCTPLQAAMLSETARGSQAYCNIIELQVEPGVSSEMLVDAFHKLALDNEILRSGFAEWQNGFVSTIFKILREEQLQFVDEFQNSFNFGESQGWLLPFRIQIKDLGSEKGHRIVLHIHHAIYDGWSMDILTADLSVYLKSHSPKSRTRFRDVVKFYNQDLKRHGSDSTRAFWTEHLLGWSGVPFPKLVRESYTSEKVICLTDTMDDYPNMVGETAVKIGCGTQVFFQAALALVWSGIQGSSDVVIGSVTSGRTIPVVGIEDVIGPCIASLPLRVDISRMSTMLEVLVNIQTNNRAIMEHCTLPLSEIKKLVALPATQSMYDILFVYQESLVSRTNKEGLVQQSGHIDISETKVLVEVQPKQNGFEFQVTYHSDHFPLEFARNFLQQFKRMVQILAEDPTCSIRSAAGSIRSELSININDTMTPREVPTLAEVVEATVTRTPDAEALCFSTNLATQSIQTVTMSYRELNEKANQIAGFIQTRGVQPGQIVAIDMEKSPQLYISILAIIKTGCAYLPLLPSTPVARIQEIFMQARIKHCLVDKTSLRTVADIPGIDFIEFDLHEENLDSFDTYNKSVNITGSDLAYVVFTSGTTGVPKGVAVTQDNIVNNITYLNTVYPRAFKNESRLLQACSQAFDVSVFEIFYTWHAGMCLCAATNDVLFADLELAIRKLKITHLSLTPTVAALIDPLNVPEVEFLVTAGEPMTRSVRDRWGELLWQGYGPSETTNICSVKQMKANQHIDHLGHVFPNTSVFVLHAGDIGAVPRGWVGEFCFGGEQVARGYLNMPELTKAKFIDHPEFGRIYRSGDMGRMLSDGSLLILGRIDDQIKLRGQRIEAGEINSIITGTKVAESAVTIMVERDNIISEQLTSFYVQKSENSSFRVLEISFEANRTLFGMLKSRLPSYMVPSYLVAVSQIPLTSSGKVDKRQLQTCFQSLPKAYIEAASDSAHANAIDDDWSEMENSVARVIADVTGTARDDIGRWTPFTTLGLDSISAISVAREMNKNLETRVSISAILQNPSVAQLCSNLNTTVSESERRDISELLPSSYKFELTKMFTAHGRDVSEILPCSPLQESMLANDHGSYYNKILLRLHIPPEQMKEYWDIMIQRHAILRTCFCTTDNTDYPIAQVVLKNWSIPWKLFEVTMPSLDGAIYTHLNSLPEPLDSRIPPLSLGIIRYKGSRFLTFICHHALYDGVAMENLWREVETLAAGSKLPPPVSYKPLLQDILTLPRDTENFWAAQLAAFRPSLLFAQSGRKKPDQCTHTVSLGMPLTDVRRKTQSLGISLLSLCQASWASVVSVSSNNLDVCFGNVMSGRTSSMEGLDKLVAPCFNTVPIRKDVSGAAQNIELVKSFQRLNADLLKYQFTPLRKIQKLATGQRSSLFDTLLLLQRPLQEMDDKVWTLEEDYGDMDIPVVCEIVPCPSLNSIVINIYYDMNVVSGDSAALFADLLRHFLKNILTSPYSVQTARKDLPPAFQEGLEELTVTTMRPEEVQLKTPVEEQWTDLESRIRRVLSELSNISRSSIQRHTSIFRLGLDSINAVQVAAMLRRQGQVVSASDVVESPSCAKLADRLLLSRRKVIEPPQKYDFEQFSREVSSQIESQIFTSVDEIILPCTQMQGAMLASFIRSSGDDYLNLSTYKIDDGLSATQLLNSWRTLQERHPMLRTGFSRVNHRDSSFAMIQYSATSVDCPVMIGRGDGDEPFSLCQWKDDATLSFLQSLQLPPWKVALVEEGSQLTMHILMHHALYDAQSLNEILNNLAISARNGNPWIYPDIKPGLSVILKESQRCLQEAENFWQSKSRDAVVNSFPAMTPLREADRKVKIFETHSSSPLSLLTGQLRDLDVSTQAVLQAAWARVLASYLGEDSVVFGVTLSGRMTEETKAAPFPCLTTIPIVASNTASNAELITSMMEYNRQVHKYIFSPLSQVQKWLGHPAIPVFDTLLVYQRLESIFDEKRPWEFVNDAARVEYPVSLEIEPAENDTIRLTITYFSDVLPEEQAKLILQQFDAELLHLVNDPKGNNDGLHRTCPDLFAISPAVSPEIPAPVEFLHQFVEQRAITHPGDIALEFISDFKGQKAIKSTWTYQEFNDIGNQVANLLVSETTVGSIVAIHFNKCPEAYFSILGILKAGCSFVALDPSAPSARKEFILQDSQSPCLLTNGRDTLDFEVSSVKIIHINEANTQSYPNYLRDIGPQFTSQNTCYCLYTSGTTGTPKGCEITHENAVQAMMAFQELFHGHWDADSRWLQFAALHFDVSVLEQYWSWSVGITVVAAPRDLILDDLTGSINKLAITHIDLTPSLARLTHPDEVPTLCKGVFITGGEQLKQEILDAWGPTAVIYNAYGPTEATIGVTMYQRVPQNGRPSNIGRQFSNVGSYIFRPGTEVPVLRGAVGELCVSGKLVGKGYLNRPELTSTKFPTLTEFNERIYRTGDLVRILHDGCFDFLGRADDQVKLRGQRLEIGEINHIIRTGAPQVKDIATIVSRHGANGKDVLVTFLVGQSPSSEMLRLMPDEENLSGKARAACRSKLPGYMVPTYFLPISYIPLSSNNKAEAKELKKLFDNLSPEELLAISVPRANPVSAAESEIAQKVINAIVEYADFASVDITEATSIFDLGVDSISALQLSSFMKKKGLKTASSTMLLRNPVIADLATALLDNAVGSHQNRVLEAKQSIYASHQRFRAFACRELNIKLMEIEYIAPCSGLQQGMLSRAMTDDSNGIYFNSFEIRLADTASMDKLQQAWLHLITLHAVLRTAFVSTPDGYVQVAQKHKDIPWLKYESRDKDETDKLLKHAKGEWISKNRPNVTTPLKFVSISGSSESTIVVYIFHALYDGISFDQIMRELKATYYGDGMSPSPRFVDALAHGPLWRHDDSRAFWLNHLIDWTFKPLQKFGDFDSIEPAMATRTVAASNVESIRRQLNVTLQSVVLASWIYVLRAYTAKPLATGVIAAGRTLDLPEIDKTIGPLFNTLPFFSSTIHGQSWRSLIGKCHDFNTSTLSFQHVPLQSIQKWCSKGQPIFDNLFAFQLQTLDDAVPTNHWSIKDGPLNPDYPLAFEATKLSSGEIQLRLVTQGHIANASVLEEMLDRIQDTMASMVVDDVLKVEEEYTNPSHSEPGLAITEVNDYNKLDDQYQWTDLAMAIRTEIGLLAGISPDDITAHRTLLELGIDSIDVIKISAKLRKKAIELPASHFIRHQTIARMTDAAETHHSDSRSEDTDNKQFAGAKMKLDTYVEGRGFDMNSIEAVWPPTPLQESMVAGMIQSDFEWYFNHDILEISENVDLERLKTSWDQVIASSPILRTGFLEVDDNDLNMAYCQVVFKPGATVITEVHLTEMAHVENLIKEATTKAKQQYGLKHLFQVTVATFGIRRFIAVSIAHSLYDGWSLSLLYRDLQRAYDQNLQVRPSPENFLSRVMPLQTSEHAKDFWAGYLDEVEPCLVVSQAAPPHQPPAPTVYRREILSRNNIQKLQGFCKTVAVSLQVLCQACWAVVLARRTKSLEVVFGIILSGRDFEGSDELLFPTMNTVALRCILHGSSREFLGYLEDSISEIREYQAFPLRKAQLAAKVPGELFNSLFLMQKTLETSDSQGFLTSVHGKSNVDYPVCVEAEAKDDTLVWRVACQSGYFSQVETETLITELDAVMQFFTTANSQDMLTFEEQQVSICGLPAIIIRDPAILGSDEKVIVNDPIGDVGKWDDLSLTIRNILSDVSGIPFESIPMSCGLYHLGLDSISGIKVSVLLRKEGVYINPRDLLKATSIPQMAKSATQLSDSSDSMNQDKIIWTPPSLVNLDKLFTEGSIVEDDVELLLPALPMQVYMMSVWQNEMGAVFFPEFCFNVDGNVDGSHIYNAWQSLLDRIPMLRTCLVATGLQELPFMQVVLKKESLLNTTGIRPMIQLVVLKSDVLDQHKVRLRIHHALYDGVSLPTILEDFRSLLDGAHLSTAEKSASRWAHYAIQPTTEANKETRKQFWSAYLHGCHTPQMKNEDSRDTRERVSYLQKSALADASLLKTKASQHGISIQSLFLAAYAKTIDVNELGDSAENKTVVFGIYLANRTADDNLETIYPTLNLVPLKVHITSNNGNLVSTAQAIQADLLEISTAGRANVGLWEIAAWTGVKITSFVNFLSLPDVQGASSGEVKLTPIQVNDVTTRGELSVEEKDALSHPLIKNNAVRDAFPAAIDVEAALQGEGLDIGVFGAKQCLSEVSAAALAARIIKHLHELDS